LVFVDVNTRTRSIIFHFFIILLPTSGKPTDELSRSPSMGIVEGMNGLRDIIPELDKRFRYAVEVRDSSWFQDLAYSFFANNNMCMVWSQIAGLRAPPIVTTDFLYIRFIGDRTIQEKDFGKIQKVRVSEIKRWDV
jgi:uncharacterized protein YecE (DUF72 family)